MNWRFFFGILVGVLLCVLGFFYKSTITKYGVAVSIGFLLAFAILTMVGILLYFGLKNKLVVGLKRNEGERDDPKTTDLQSTIMMLFPKMGKEQASRLQRFVEVFLSGRIFFLSINMALSLVIIIGGLIGTLLLVDQNALISAQLQRLDTQNESLGEQNQLIRSQTTSIETQTSLFEGQNELIEVQNTNINKQTSFIAKQSQFEERAFYASQYREYRRDFSNTDHTDKYRAFLFNEMVDLVNERKVPSKSLFSDFSISDFTDLSIVDKNITGFQFRFSQFKNTVFENVVFENCLFEECALYGAEFKNVSFRNCNISGNRFSISYPTADVNNELSNLVNNAKHAFNLNRFSGEVIIDSNSDIENNVFRFNDLRRVSLDWGKVTENEIRSGFFFGAILSANNSMSIEKFELLKEFGAIFDRRGAEDFLQMFDEKYSRYNKHPAIQRIKNEIDSLKF